MNNNWILGAEVNSYNMLCSRLRKEVSEQLAHAPHRTLSRSISFEAIEDLIEILRDEVRQHAQY